MLILANKIHKNITNTAVIFIICNYIKNSIIIYCNNKKRMDNFIVKNNNFIALYNGDKIIFKNNFNVSIDNISPNIKK